MTTFTKRISGAVSSAITGRVFTTDATSDIPPVFSNDSWGGAWGNTWGKTWFFASPLVPGTDTKPALEVRHRVAEEAAQISTSRVSGDASVDATPRVSGEPTQNITKRV